MRDQFHQLLIDREALGNARGRVEMFKALLEQVKALPGHGSYVRAEDVVQMFHAVEHMLIES